MKCLIAIPARMGATRFPGKPLVDLLGRPMVQWVYEAAVQSGVADRVVIATPDQEIVDAAASFGGEAVLTRHDHLTGTDRLAEVAEKIPAEVIINVQGDEPLIRPESIALCARPLLDSSEADLSSIYSDCPENEYDDPATVKVVTDEKGYALYFSRYAIPFARNERVIPVKKHVGLYGYRAAALKHFAVLPPSPLEQAESLEQLRFLYHGYRMVMSKGEGTELAIDTPEHVDRVIRLLQIRTGIAGGS